MKSKIFVVYDSKVQAYLPPFFMRSKGEALRAWEATANDPKTNVSMYPGDFTLFEIGEFDDQSGIIELYQAKMSLGTGLEFKRAPILTGDDNVTAIKKG